MAVELAARGGAAGRADALAGQVGEVVGERRELVERPGREGGLGALGELLDLEAAVGAVLAEQGDDILAVAVGSGRKGWAGRWAAWQSPGSDANNPSYTV